VESFKLDVAAALLEQIHHGLEIFRLTDITRHDCEVVTLQQQLAQQLYTTAQNTRPLRVKTSSDRYKITQNFPPSLSMLECVRFDVGHGAMSRDE